MIGPSLDAAKALFDRALGLPPDQRVAFIEGGSKSPETIELVLALLAVHLESPEFQQNDARIEQSAKQIPDSVGEFHLLSKLGEGGMGVVYEAQQSRPHRRVAVKLLRFGMLSSRNLRRFENEAEILARLHHPGIAQVYGAGTAVHGGVPTPYFAMELIAGVPITRYVQQQRLGTRQRLALIIEVCEAVHHAHLKGVVHRDIKPGNILVDSAGRSKVLDFGVARLTDSDIHTTREGTEIGQLVGTLPYMSPEQVQGNSNDIDCRSDVYALGVLAFELLTGRLPHDVRNKPLFDAARDIVEMDPVRVGSIDRTLRGDVETIISKALEKDRHRRYQSAESLCADLRRYLRAEPIDARPSSTGYHAIMFARRQRALVGGVAATLLALVVGMVAVSLSLHRALSAESSLANQVEATKRSLHDVEQVAAFQAEMLARVEPEEVGAILTRGVIAQYEKSTGDFPYAENTEKQLKHFSDLWGRINATDAALGMIDSAMLAPALVTITEQFADRPELACSLRQTVADAYASIGFLDSALPIQEDVVASRRSLLGEDDPSTIDSVNNLAVLLRDLGDLDRAEALQLEAVERNGRIRGPEHEETLGAISNLAVLLLDRGKAAEASVKLQEVAAIQRRVLGGDDPRTLTTLSSLGRAHLDSGHLSEAAECFRLVYEARSRTLGESDSGTLRSLSNLAGVLFRQGKADAAETYLTRSLNSQRALLGSEHHDTLTAMNNLAYVCHSQRKYVEAERLYRDALAGQMKALGDAHPDTLNTCTNLGTLLIDRGAPTDALEFLLKVEPLARRANADGVFHRLGVMLVCLGKAHAALSQFSEAERYLIEAHELLVIGGAATERDARSCAQSLVSLYESWDQSELGDAHAAQLRMWQDVFSKGRVPSPSAPVP